MKAYTPSLELSHNSRLLDIDIGPEHFLPDVRCSVCEEEWGAPGFSFCSVNAPSITEFVYKQDGDNPVLSWADFTTLRERIERENPQIQELIPGAAIGLLSGTAHHAKLPQAFFDGSRIFFDKTSVDQFRALGISERFAPVSILLRGRVLAECFTIEPEIVHAVSACQRRQLVRRQCLTCGFLDINPVMQHSCNSIHWSFSKTTLESHPYCFVSREIGMFVFTEKLKSLVEKLKIPQLKFRHCGEFI